MQIVPHSENYDLGTSSQIDAASQQLILPISNCREQSKPSAPNQEREDNNEWKTRKVTKVTKIHLATLKPGVVDTILKSCPEYLLNPVSIRVNSIANYMLCETCDRAKLSIEDMDAP